MKEKYELGFFNDSASVQNWAVYLDQISIAEFSLAAHTGTARYVNVELADGEKVVIDVTTTMGNAAADLARSGSQLVLTSPTPREWELDQETRNRYVVKCKLA